MAQTEGNPQASKPSVESERVARAVVIVALAVLWEEWRGTGAEKPILDEMALRVREYKALDPKREQSAEVCS
jgi:hypothetical protein